MTAPYAETLPLRLAAIRERIEDACARGRRSSAQVDILAVTKYHPLEAASAAYAAGLRSFGENRVQEAEAKYAGFREDHPGTRLELLGHLQGNKVNRALRLFDRLQSVDSLELLAALAERSPMTGGVEILLELNAGEASKTGFPDAAGLLRACDFLAERMGEGLPCPILRGFMTMAPLTDDPVAVRRAFRTLREVRDRALDRHGFPDAGLLSMGMSGDFELAVEEGATLLRLGTALFGEPT